MLSVVEQAVHIGCQQEANGIYHLTQPNSPRIGDTVNAIFDQLGFARPVAAEEGEELDWLDAKLNKQLDFYSSYIRGCRSFDCARSHEATQGHTASRKETPSVQNLVEWYIPRLEQERSQGRSAR